jgi:sec-independent protein translocase protein TatC
MWLFVAPGLYESERKYLIPIALLSAIFFVVGACFGYFVVFPYGFEFFVGYATDIVKPMPSLSEYFNFAVQMLIAFGVIFELPLVIFFLARLGVVTGKWLRQKQKYAVLVIFIVAAILTPPDVVSQLLMAAPLLVLYEIGVWVAYLFGTKKPLPEEEAA